MPKMKAAKMDVVRFTESDVIVASGNLVTLSGCDDDTTNNMLIKKGNTTLFSNSTTNPVNTLVENGYVNNPEFSYYNKYGTSTKKSTLNDIADNESWGYLNSYYPIDGDYTWNGEVFTKIK